MITRTFFLIFIFISTLFSDINISENTKEVSILNKSMFYLDTTSKLDISDILTKKFQPLNKSKIKQTYSNYSIWIKFTLHNRSNTPLNTYLYFTNPLLDKIELYTIHKNAIKHRFIGADYKSHYSMDNVLHPFFKLSLQKKESKTYYLRVQSLKSANNFELFLKNQTQLYEDEFTYQLIKALFLGTLLAFLIYNIFLFLFTKELTFLYYIVFILCLFTHSLIYSLMLYYLVDQEDFYKFVPIAIVAAFFANFFALLFIREILALQQYKKLNKVINIFVITTLFLFILLFTTPYIYVFAPIYTLSNFIFIASLIIFSIVKKNHNAKYILIGWLFNIIGISSLAAKEFYGVGPIEYFPYFFEFCVLSEVILFSVFLASKLNKTQELEQALAINKMLSEELHHRIKNNMQLISFTYRGKLETVLTPLIEDKLNETEIIIQTMSKTHEYLYNSIKLKNINTKEYFENICSNVKNKLLQKEINLSLNIQTNLDLEKSLYCGLIINELLTNSIKYAFDKNKGEITISLIKIKNKYVLSYDDNGKGFNYKEIKEKNSFGLYFIETLTNLQLKGSIKYDTKDKTNIILNFI